MATMATTTISASRSVLPQRGRFDKGERMVAVPFGSGCMLHGCSLGKEGGLVRRA